MSGVDEYINSVSGDLKEIVIKIRKAIQEASKDLKEEINCMMR